MEATTLERIKALVLELRLALDELDEPLPQVKAESIDESNLTGIVGRPEVKMFGGKARWVAGLGIQDGSTTQWVNLTAWGNVAEAAKTFPRGAHVVVSGVMKKDSYVGNDGVLKSRTSFTVSHICLAADVFSVAAD